MSDSILTDLQAVIVPSFLLLAAGGRRYDRRKTLLDRINARA